MRKKHFVLVGNGRTGSTWLTSLLGDYSGTFADFELKWSPEYEPAPLHLVLNDESPTITELLDARIDSERPCIGSKLILDPYRFLSEQDAKSLFSKFDDSLKVVYLFRDYFSLNLSFMRGAFNLPRENLRNTRSTLVGTLSKVREENLVRQDVPLNLEQLKDKFVENLIVLLYNDLLILKHLSNTKANFLPVEYEDIGDKASKILEFVSECDVDQGELDSILANPSITKLKPIQIEGDNSVYEQLRTLSRKVYERFLNCMAGSLGFDDVFCYENGRVCLLDGQLLDAIEESGFDKRAFQRESDRGIQFCFSLPVWGEKYLEYFSQNTIKLLLADGNIPFLARQKNVSVKFCLYSNEHGLEQLKQEPLLASLSEYVRLEYHDMDSFEADAFNKYSRMNACHLHSLENALKLDAFYVPLVADSVISGSFYTYCLEKIEQGFEAILTRPFRMDAGKFDRYIKRNFESGAREISINSNDICDSIFEVMHKEEYFDNVYSPQTKMFSKNRVNWIDEGKTIITRNVRYFPSVSKVGSSFKGCHTVDDGAILQSFEDRMEKVFIVTNPRDCFAGSIADDSDIFETTYGPFNHFSVGEFIAENVTPFFLQFFKQAITLNVSGCSENFVNRADSDFKEIMRCYEICEQHKNARHAKGALAEQYSLPPMYRSADFLNTVSKKFEGLLAKYPEVYIYGAGIHTKVLLYSSACYSNIVALIDQNESLHGEELWGYRVQGVDSLCQRPLPVVISSYAYEDEIYKQLRTALGSDAIIHKLYSE